jgi:hypothetical protein
MKIFAIAMIVFLLSLGSIFYFFNDLFVNKQINSRPCSDIQFDSGLWKDSLLVRGRMVNDIINSKKLISLSRDSVEHLLGKASASSNDMIEYLVNMNCGNKENGDFMLLYVELDSVKNKVTNCWLTD